MPTLRESGILSLSCYLGIFNGVIMFERLTYLIGNESVSKLHQSNVLIVGIGGVGGYALEALVRSGIEKITIVDGDIIDVTNLNRQIITNNDNIGLSKCKVAKDRALKINPNLKVKIIDK